MQQEIAHYLLSRRQVLKGAVGALAGVACPAALGQDAGGAEKPDIFFLVLDALRAASLPFHGNPRNTAPFLQQLAAQSTVYSRCYTSATWTRPAVWGLLLGLTPREHDATRLESMPRDDMRSFPQALADQGYQTALFSANRMVGEGFGLERHFQRRSFEATEKQDGMRLLEEVERWLSPAPDGPLFGYLHFFEPHAPYRPPSSYVDQLMEEARRHPFSVAHLEPRHRQVDPSGADMLLGRIPHVQLKVSNSADPLHHQALYEANILYGDAQVSRFFAFWRSLGRRRRTIFVITGDHGEGMGEHGLFFGHSMILLDCLLHVPLILHDTAAPAPLRIDTPVSHLDLANSIARWAGSQESFGSLGLPILAPGRPLPGVDRPLVSQEVGIGHASPKKGEIGCALTQGRWRLVYNDFPHLAGDCVVRTLIGPSPSRVVGRAPLDFPATSLRRARRLAPGVELIRLALHTPYAEANRAYGFSGRLAIENDQGGTLHLRVRLPGCEPIALGPFRCEGPYADFEGQLPPVETDQGAPAILGVWDAAWSETPNPSAPPPDSPDWTRLFAFPIHTPWMFGDDLLLVGASFEPVVACPGDWVRINLIWRCLQDLDLKKTFTVQALDANGGVLLDMEPQLFLWFCKNKRDELLQRDSRFEEPLWLRVPANAPAGPVRLCVRVSDSDRTALPADALVAANRVEGLKELIRRDEDPFHFALPDPESIAREPNQPSMAAALAQYARRFPEEGQAMFLLTALTDDPRQREQRLRQCLDAVPLHRGALERAVDEPWGARFTRELKQLRPPLDCDFRFLEAIRLRGYDVRRSPENDTSLYFTLYWEALAPVARPYGVELRILDPTAPPAEGRSDPPSTEVFWFLGSHLRPTFEWNAGESLVETVKLHCAPGQGIVTLWLRLYPYWDFIYSAQLEKYALPAAQSDGQPIQRVVFGPFTYLELPVAERNLLAYKRADKANYFLFDLDADPCEFRNLVDEKPDVFAYLRQQLAAVLSSDTEKPETAGANAVISPETMEKLRAIGYID
ncbi:MAG: sulfatase [Candidatus Sumerlaeota bacterium]|nr:sulfatase [Candidatus Sumerlaeota bacterium]